MSATIPNHIEHSGDLELEKCRSVIAVAEIGLLERFGEERAPGQRELLCGIASYLVKHAAEFESLDTPIEGVTAKVTNVWKMLAVARGRSMQEVLDIDAKIKSELVYPEETSEAFVHAVCIVQQGSRYFLGDLTFCQFLDPQTSLIGSGPHKSTGVRLPESQIAIGLLDDGFFELTPASLKEYFKIVTRQGTEVPDIGPDQLAGFIANCPPLDENYEKGELDRILYKN